MHGTALMLSALSLQDIALLIEALALDYNAGQDAAIQLEISSNCRRRLADPRKRMEQTAYCAAVKKEACPLSSTLRAREATAQVSTMSR